MPLVDDWEGVALQQQGGCEEPMKQKKKDYFSLSLSLSILLDCAMALMAVEV